MKARFIIILLVVLLLAGPAAAWLDGYQYRQVHAIGGSTSDLTDYAVPFTVYSAAGTSSGSEIYTNGNANADWSDLRFATDLDFPMSYWIEESDATSAVVWVKIPYIPTSGTEMYVYYGNASTISESNGDATFLFFDDFEGSSLDAGKWSIVTGAPEIIDSILYVQGGTAEGVQSLNTFQIGTAFSSKSYIDINYTSNYIGYYQSSSENAIVLTSAEPIKYYARTRTGGVGPYIDIGNDLSGWHKWEIIRISLTETSFYVDETLKADSTTGITPQANPLRFYASSGSYVRTDWVFVRPYTVTEPSHTTWTAEQEYIPPPEAEFEADILSGFTPLMVNFTDLSTGDPTEWAWYFGCEPAILCPFSDPVAPNSTDQNPVWIFEEPGTYNVTLVASTIGGSDIEQKVDYIEVLDPSTYAFVIEPSMLPIEIDDAFVAVNGTKYILGGDWTAGLEDTYAVFITANTSGLYFNGSNHLLTGGAAGGSAIGILTNNVGVVSVHAEGWEDGIRAFSASNIYIENSELSNNTNRGIYVNDGLDIFIANNTLLNNIENGIGAEFSTNVYCMDPYGPNSVSGSRWGIFYNTISGGNITGAFLDSNSNGGIGVMESSGITIEGASVYNTAGEDWAGGIIIDNCSALEIIDNLVTGSQNNSINLVNLHSGSLIGNTVSNSGENAINGNECTGLTISGNTLYESQKSGIGIGTCSDIQVNENTISNVGDHGIVIGACSDIQVNENEVSGFTNAGILASNSLAVSSVDNNVSNGFIGIWYDNVTGTLIEGNWVTGTTEQGVGAVGQSQDIIIKDNLITDNQRGFCIEAVNLTIYNNYLNNAENAGIDVLNSTDVFWNVDLTPGENCIGGSLIGGNYWAQPDGFGYSQTASDSDGDGICDDPFVLADGNTDYYPLGGTPPEALQSLFSADPTEGTIRGDGSDSLVVYFFDESTGPVDTWFWDFGDGSSILVEGPEMYENPIHEYIYPGLYGVTLTVTDSSTGQSSTSWLPIYVRPEIPNGVPIWQGWNFVSVPRNLADGHNTAEEVFGSVETDGRPIWSYDAASGVWTALTGTSEIKTLEGYWIYSNQLGPYIEFTYSSDFGGQTPRVKHLEQGWNAIGMGSVYGMDTILYLASIDEAWSMLLEFDSALQTYYPPQIHWMSEWNMQPTRGYWIYMKEPGDLLAVTG